MYLKENIIHVTSSGITLCTNMWEVNKQRVVIINITFLHNIEPTVLFWNVTGSQKTTSTPLEPWRLVNNKACKSTQTATSRVAKLNKFLLLFSIKRNLCSTCTVNTLMLLLLLNYVVLRALWKIDVHLISTLVNKSLYYYLLLFLLKLGYGVE